MCVNINVFIKHFRKLGTFKNVTNQDYWVLNDHNIQGNDSLNRRFSEDEKGKVITKLKIGNCQVVTT